jgi:hypothetical protein
MEIVNLQRGMWCLIYKLVRHQRSSPPPDWWVGGCQSITRLLLITAVSRRQKVRDGSTTLYSFSVGCQHEPIACPGHAVPCEGSIGRCRIADCSGRRSPRTVAQLWLAPEHALPSVVGRPVSLKQPIGIILDGDVFSKCIRAAQQHYGAFGTTGRAWR